MALPQQGGELENRIVTSFELEGDKKIEEAIKRIQLRQSQYFENIDKRAKQVATTQDKVNKAFLELDRQNALAKITKDFTAAAKTGKDFEGAMKRVKAQLDEVKASQAEVNRVIQAGGAAARGGANKGDALATLGTELRALPAVQTPFGFSTDVIAKFANIIGRLGFGLNELLVAGPLAVGALIAVGVAFQNFQATVQPAIDLLNNVAKARRETAGLLASGDAEDIVAARDAALKDLTRLEAERTQAIQDAATTFGATRDGDFLKGVIGGLGRLGIGPLAEFSKVVSDTDSSIAAAKIALAELNKAYDENIAKIEAERLAKAQQALQDQLLQTQISTLTQVIGGSTDSIDRRIETIQAEQKAIEQVLNAGQGSVELQEQLKNRLATLGTELSVLAYNVRPAVEETERLAKAEQYLKDQRKEMADLTEKFNADVEKLESQAAEQRLALQQKFNDRIIDLAQKAADAAEDALRKLEDKRDDLKTDLSRDQNDEAVKFQEEQLDAQIEYQRDAAKLARDHANTLKEIDRKSKFDSRQAIQDRDAIALQAAEDEKTQSIKQANDRLASEKDELEIAHRETLEDQRAQYAREQQQRMLKYQRDLEDAQLQYNRELEQQNINNARALRDLMVQTARELALTNDKNTQQLKLVRDAYAQELQIVAMGQGERLRLEAIHQAQLIAQARRTLMGMSQAPTTFPGGPTRTMAIGGNLRAGQTALTNEVRRESWTDRSGRTIALPEGRGYFTPTSDGRVNQTAGGGSTIQLNMNGATVQTIDVRSRAQAMQVFSDVLDEAGVA